MKNLSSTITSKGQVTIPSYIRDKLKLDTGSKLEFIIQGDSFVALPITRSIRDLRGILPKPNKSLTIEEMNQAVQDIYDRS